MECLPVVCLYFFPIVINIAMISQITMIANPCKWYPDGGLQGGFLVVCSANTESLNNVSKIILQNIK